MSQSDNRVFAYALAFLAVAVVAWLTLVAGAVEPGATLDGLGGPDLLRVLT